MADVLDLNAEEFVEEDDGNKIVFFTMTQRHINIFAVLIIILFEFSS